MTVDPDDLADRVDAPVYHFDSLPSTNDAARRRAREGDPHGTIVVADEQAAGRGRNGSEWAAPSGGLWASVVCRPDLAPAHVGRLTFAGGLAVAEAVDSVGVDAKLAWPNDVVVEGDDDRDRKLAGVLTEAVVDSVPVTGKPVDEVLPGVDPDAADLSFAVLGIGVNANVDSSALDVDRAVATLADERGEPVDVDGVAATLHDRLVDWTRRVETDDGFADALDAWRERSATLGRRVRVERRDGETIEGTAADLAETGALVVETAAGEVAVTEGECDRVRPR